MRSIAAMRSVESACCSAKFCNAALIKSCSSAWVSMALPLLAEAITAAKTLSRFS